FQNRSSFTSVGRLGRAGQPEADRRQGRLIHRGRVGNLQEQLFGGLLDRRTFEDDGAVRPLFWAETPAGNLEDFDRELSDGVPLGAPEDAGRCPASELNLRWDQLDA